MQYYYDITVRSRLLSACVDSHTGALVPELVIGLTGDPWTHPDSGGIYLTLHSYAHELSCSRRTVYRYEDRHLIERAGVHVCGVGNARIFITNVNSIAAQRELYDSWSEQKQVATRYTSVSGGTANF